MKWLWIPLALLLFGCATDPQGRTVIKLPDCNFTSGGHGSCRYGGVGIPIPGR